LTEQGVRQEIIDGISHRVARVARAELPAGFDGKGPRSQSKVNVQAGSEKVSAGTTEGPARSAADFEIGAQSGSGPALFPRDRAMPGVVAELHNVPVTVIRLPPPGMGAAAHLAGGADGGESHR